MKEKINSYISGIGFYAPEKIINNEYFTNFMDTSDQWISERTGIKQRRFVNKGQGPADIAVPAVEMALKNANLEAKDIDAVIVSAANLQRAYPAIAIEVQEELGIEGFAYDMMVGCSASTFGINNAYCDIKSGKSSKVLVISPEITSGHNNFKNRDGHFIFGDICTAVVVEKNSQSKNKFKILNTKLKTSFLLASGSMKLGFLL